MLKFKFGVSLRASTALFPASLLLLVASTSPALSQEIWQGPGSDFNDGTNWVGGTAPSDASVAIFIANSAPTNITTSVDTQVAALSFMTASQSRSITLGAPMTVGTVGNASGTRQNIIVGANTLTLNGATGANVHYSTAAGGSITLSGVSIGGDSSYEMGGALIFDSSGGRVSLGSLSVGSTGSIANAGFATVTAAIGSLNTNTTIAGAIGGGAGDIAIDKVGTGTLTLSAANTYGGGTTISAGTLQVTARGALGTGNVTNNGALEFSVNESIDVENNISGTGSVTIRAQAKLSGANSYSGGTIINGFLFVADDSAMGAATGGLTFGNGFLTTESSFTSSRAIQLTGNGTLEPVSGTTLTLSGVISGSGSLANNGTGTLVLSGVNSYTGNTVLNGGVTQISSDAALGNSGVLFLNGGALQTTESLIMARNISLQAAGGTFAPDAGKALTLTGVISGKNLTKTGAGTLVLTGTNTYEGTRISAGTLQIGNGGTTGTLGTDAVINNAALVFNRSDVLTVSGAISGTGTLVQMGAGTTVLTGANIYSGTTTISAGGTLQIGDGSTTGSLGSGAVTIRGTLTFNRSDALTVGNLINGTGGLVQNGFGVLTLPLPNGYTGGTSINAGTVALGNMAALGSGAVTLANGALLSNVSGGFRNNIVINADTTGTVSAAAGQTLLLVADLTIGNGGALVVGSLNDTGAVVADFSSLTKGSIAHLRVAGGTLRLAPFIDPFVLKDFSSTTISSGSTLDLNGHSGNITTLANIQGSGTLINTGETTIHAGNFAGAITGSGRLSKVSVGTLILSGTNDYSGSTTVSDGTLQIGNGGATGTLGSGDVVVGTTLAFNRSDPALTVVNAISGDGKVRQVGTGTTTLLGALSHTGGTFVDNGNLVLGDALNTVNLPGDATIAATGSLILANGSLGNGLITNYGNLSLVSAAAGGGAAYTGHAGSTMDLSGMTASGATLGSIAGTGAIDLGGISLTVGDDRSTTFAGVIADGGDGGGTGGALTKVGTGALTLTGSNSYTGLTTISAGTLLVNGSLGGDLSVASGATLGGAGVIGGDVTVEGALSAGNSPGTLTVNGDLTLQAGSTSLFELNAPGVVGGAGVGGNDLVRVGGALALGGTLDARVAAAGFYRLFDYGTLAPGSSFAEETISSTNVDFTVDRYEIRTDVAQQVNLSVLSEGQTLQFWNGIVGGGSGTWQNFDSGWANDTGIATGGWAGSVGIFAGTAGTVTVSDTQSIDTLQFKTDGYIVQGGALAFDVAGGGTLNVDTGVSATIASTLQDGAGSMLTKVGGGTVILSGSNTYTGGTALLGGVLSVSSDSNLGNVAGALNLDGGILAATASFDSSRAISLTLGGFDVASGSTLGLAGAIAGTGDLHKLGAGTLVLSGANAYGDTFVEAGTLIGNAGSISGNIGIAAGALGIFDQTANASFAGDISGLNGNTGTLLKRGSGTLTLAGNSSLNWEITAGGLTSAAERFGGNAAIATGASLAFSQSSNGTYAGTLSGAGSFSKLGTGTAILTGDSSAFTGTTTVSGGALVVGQGGAGKLGGTLNVLAGGTLGGSGMVGSTVIGTGGKIAPGNSIGTLNVAGNIGFAAGSIYEVETNAAGEADKIAASGTATIDGGSVRVLAGAGNYRPETDYAILTADGGVAGTFTDVTSNLAFLDPSLVYGAGTVTLRLTRNDIGFTGIGLTPNQIAAGAGTESLGWRNPVTDAVMNLSAEQARYAFDELSGEIHASAHTVMIEDSRFVRHAVWDRLHDASDDDRGGTWGQAIGSWGHTGSNGNAARLDRSTGGVLMGIDRASDTLRLGVVGGYSHTQLAVDARGSSGKIDSFHLGAYAGGEWDNVALRTGLAYSWQDIHTARTIGFAGFSDTTHAGYDGGTFQAFGELGYAFDLGSGKVEPFANLAYVRTHSDAFKEAGGDASLFGGKAASDVTFSTLGLRATTTFKFGKADATFRAATGWQHVFGDRMPITVMRYQTSGDAFSISGLPVTRDAAIVDFGLDVAISSKARIGISYNGQVGSQLADHSARAGISVSF